MSQHHTPSLIFIDLTNVSLKTQKERWHHNQKGEIRSGIQGEQIYKNTQEVKGNPSHITLVDQLHNEVNTIFRGKNS